MNCERSIFSYNAVRPGGHKTTWSTKKIARRMLLPHHAWPFTLPYEHEGMQHGKELKKCLMQQVTLRIGGTAIDCSTRVNCA